MVSVQINGSAQLRRVADGIRATGDRGLGKEMSSGLRKVAKPVQTSIRASADETMPSGGGYQAAFAKSLRFRTDLRNARRDAFFKLTTFADGKAERRDIGSLNRGKLRHPVYGRSRPKRGGGRQPNPWAVTSIKPGFHDRGTAAAADLAEKEMSTVLDDLASRLAKG